MTTVNVSMPDEMMAFVNAQFVEEGYDSPDEYLQALVHDAQERRAKRALEDKLQEAVDDGPGEPLTREEWDSMRQEAIDGLVVQP